jgi:hypothetical protein
MKGRHKTIRAGAKANDGVGGNWDKVEGQSDAKNLGGWADDESSEGYDPLPSSLRWGMEELQQRVYQERTAASLLAVTVTNARLLGMGGINKAEAAIQAILSP